MLPNPANKPCQQTEMHFSVLEWATIFYYADETKLLSESRKIKDRMEEFMMKHEINTTFQNFKTKYYNAKKRINEKNDYPIDKFSLIATMFNPIDLSRILILLKLDISALLGYTGAIFKKFFGTNFGLFSSLLVLSLWVLFPILRINSKLKKKDF